MKPTPSYSAAQAIEETGGRALPLALNIHDQNAVAVAVKRAAEHFGGIVNQVLPVIRNLQICGFFLSWLLENAVEFFRRLIYISDAFCT